MTGAEPLVRVESLVKHFPLRKGFFSSGDSGVVRAVDDISFTVARGETLGLVGESGCGKSTTGRLLLRLIDPTAGAIKYDGVDLARLGPKAMRERRREPPPGSVARHLERTKHMNLLHVEEAIRPLLVRGGRGMASGTGGRRGRTPAQPAVACPRRVDKRRRPVFWLSPPRRGLQLRDSAGLSPDFPGHCVVTERS